MKTIQVPVADFKRHLSDYVSQSQHGGTRIVVTKHRKSVAAVVSMEDLRRLESQKQVSGLSAIAGRWPEFEEIESAVHEAVLQRYGDSGRDVSL